MHVLMNTGGIAVTNSFLIADESTGNAVIFDAPNDTVAPLLKAARERGWDVVGLWLTHGHFDHIADHALVTREFPDANVIIHKLDEPKLIEPGSRMFELPFEIPPRSADGFVEEGQALAIGTIDVRAMHTPGHSPGHVAFYFPAEDVLVGGDLIIGGSIGRTDLPGADPKQMAHSLRRVMRLPDNTRLLPGHGTPSTLGEERAENVYLREMIGEKE
jgi:glyoxylase-like metal-dependent hydrolase (beta-lactamase superfamily II)